MEPDLPTEAEINIHDSLDERWAVKNFLGKTLEEAEAQFAENFLAYSEDLMCMGPRAFCFYIKAAISYLRSHSSRGDADALNSFCSTVDYRLDYESDALADIVPMMQEAVDALIRDYERFEASDQVYGSLPKKLARLQCRLKAYPSDSE